eukprot:m.1060 g.1060  ORF g.1060 m.1060 type:complete len:364 (+) comp5618_c0_seq1:2-1093(+)
MSVPYNKPCLELSRVPALLRQLFPISSVEKCSALVSYDDLNFLVEGTPEKDPTKRSKFILKVLNWEDSKDVQLVEETNDCMAFLHDRGLPCPVPQAGRTGKRVILHELPHPGWKRESDSPKYAIRLLSYLPGTLLHDVPQPLEPPIYHQVGKFIGQMARYLEDFPTARAIKERDFDWDLTSLPRVKQYFSTIQDPGKLNLVSEVVDKFETVVVPGLKSTPRAIIHGDLNDFNILMEKQEDGYRVSGLLDYGDLVYSHRVCDIATAMAYACIGKKDFFTLPGSILAGYQSSFPLSDPEFSLLYYLMIGRMAQSCVLGAYSYSLQPENEYLLVHAAPAWKTMEQLWTLPKEEVEENWKKLIHQNV